MSIHHSDLWLEWKPSLALHSFNRTKRKLLCRIQVSRHIVYEIDRRSLTTCVSVNIMTKGSVLVAVGMRVAFVLMVGVATLVELGRTEDKILKGRRSSYSTLNPTSDQSNRLNNPPISTTVAPLSVVPTATTTTVSFGEYCNESRGFICNTKTLLKCFRARCICSKPDDMIFDTVKGQCVAKAGAKCTLGKHVCRCMYMNSGWVWCILFCHRLLSLEPNERFKSLPCVLNAVCNNAGICECSPRFYNALNVTCIPQKSFGAYCHFDKECRQDHHLKCISGRCQCDPAVSVKHRKYEM